MPAPCTKVNAEERRACFLSFYTYPNGDEMEYLSTLFTNYLFYQRINSNQIRVHCSACGDDFLDDAPRGSISGLSDYCRCCYREGEYRAAGRYGRGDGECPSLSERHNAVFLRPGPDGALLVSAGSAYMRYVVDKEDNSPQGWMDEDEEPLKPWPLPELLYDETHRYYMAPGKLLHWKRPGAVCSSFGRLYVDAPGKWSDCNSAGEPFLVGSLLFPRPDEGQYFVFGWEQIGESALKYSQCVHFFDFPDIHRDLWRNVVSYLAWYCVRPQIEMLHKLGFDDVIEELLFYGRSSVRPNWRASAPHKFFRVTKQEFKLLRKHGRADVLKLWRACAVDMTLEQYLSVGRIVSLSTTHIEAVAQNARQLGLDVLRVFRKLPTPGDVTLWLDYIHMARKLNLDLSRPDVALPKNLPERHDACAQTIEYQTNVERLKSYRRRYRELCRKYEFQAGGWCIRVPRTAKEIVEEGKALQHCVGGYAARHMDGRVVILFLRSVEEPDRPLCTIEMCGNSVGISEWNSIAQIHGYRNDAGAARKPKAAYAALLEPWLAWLKAGSPRDRKGNPILHTDDKKGAVTA